MIKHLLQVGSTHVRNSLAEFLYLHNMGEFVAPITIYALINERCNSRCMYCDFWKRTKEQRVQELSTQRWQEILSGLRELAGNYSINFSGGEPLLREDLLDLLQWCRDAGIKAGFTTNGTLFTPANVERIVAAKPFNVNYSLDSHKPEIHDDIRGLPGCHGRISKGVRLLRDTADANGASFPIIAKPTIHNRNFDSLTDIVAHCLDTGATAVNFQPIAAHTEDIRKNFWISPEQYPRLEQEIDALIEMKHHGSPILNSEVTLRLLPRHFADESADEKYLPCRTGLRNLFIRPDGNAMLCWQFPDIGCLGTDSPRQVWLSDKARAVRKATVNCKRLCLLTCMSQKRLRDRAVMALKMLARR